MVPNKQNIFNIRISCPFWNTLARIYLSRYENSSFDLADTLFLVPNRRACQALTSAFIHLQGLKPTILPQIVPIAELDDDEIFFSGFNLNKIITEEKQTISREERLFLFIRLIMSKPNDFGLKQISLVQASSLALDLANLIDTAQNQGLSFDKLEDLVPEKYAIHWQETLKLLKIITEYWPQILAERDAVDVCELKNILLFTQARIWQEERPLKNVVAAGITASFPAIVALLKSIQKLPNGEIYFAGVDCFADDDYWNAIDESHPQYELKELFNILEINRNQLEEVDGLFNSSRENLISEIMRPATVSNQWRMIDEKLDLQQALSGLSLINCNSQRDEALVIALKMREILTIPEKTAALITYDRNLARRVAAELERFDIKIDDSAGIPLSLTPIGIFLRLIAESATNLNSEVNFISLLKNPFTLCQMTSAEFRKKTYTYETHLRQKNPPLLSDEDKEFVVSIKDKLNTFATLLASPNIEFKEILRCHIETAELLATSADTEGKFLLWRGDAGKTAAKFITKMLSSADTLGYIQGKEYLSFLSNLMSLESVRKNYGTHPRLSILGPIEARLNHFDYVILGEFNEGTWPKPVSSDMWMSRPMKQDFGFALPEKAIGILAADLSVFLAAQNVILTRAERIDGTPMKKSRWLLRLETVLKALNSDIESIEEPDYFDFANSLDKPQKYLPIRPPAPCPPVAARPRTLSASGVDLLVQDPYSAYAKYILKLYPLNDLDMSMDQRDYGTLIHGIIEEFNNLYPNQLPNNALDILLDIGEKHFQVMNIAPELMAFWKPSFYNTAKWIIEQEKDYRFDVQKVNNEVQGAISYDLPAGKFTFTAQADRVDVLKTGEINILDYKTGNIPSVEQVMSGHAFQLPLEGLIASRGTFTNISNTNVNKLIYWKLGDKKAEIDTTESDILDKSEEYLLKLISTFDFETTPYHSRPIPKFIPKNQDYVHLARIKEWSVQEEGENGDE